MIRQQTWDLNLNSMRQKYFVPKTFFSYSSILMEEKGLPKLQLPAIPHTRRSRALGKPSAILYSAAGPQQSSLRYLLADVLVLAITQLGIRFMAAVEVRSELSISKFPLVRPCKDVAPTAGFPSPPGLLFCRQRCCD